MKTIFKNFLKDNKAYISFLYELELKPERVTFDEFIENRPPDYFIWEAFFWTATIDGDPFWRDINIKWTKKVEEMKS